MTRWAGWAVAVALLVGAWFVAGATPDGEERLALPFPAAATLGASVEADNLGVTVHDVRLADRVATGGWSADGRWLVVSLDVWLVHREPGSLGLAYLRVGERTFLASERVKAYDPDAALNGWGLHVGIPQTGTLVFELPDDIAADAAASAAVLELALGTPLAALSPTQNQAGGAVVTLPLDLTTLESVAETLLPDTEWTNP